MKHRRCRRHSEDEVKKIAPCRFGHCTKAPESLSILSAFFFFYLRKLNSSSVRWTMGRESVMSEPTPDRSVRIRTSKSPTVVVTFGHRKDEDA